MNHLAIRFLLIFQIICAILFFAKLGLNAFGVREDQLPWEVLEIIEVAAFCGLLIGMSVTVWVLNTVLHRNKRIEDQLQIAGGDLQVLLVKKFAEWNLSPAEQDTALMMIKGLSNVEISNVLGKREGTIKSQNAAVYKKAGVSGRTQLISTLLEDIIDTAISRMDTTGNKV